MAAIPGLLGACAYLAVVVLLYFQQDFLVFRPRPESSQALAWADNRIEFEREDIVLRGWYIRANRPEAPTIVYYGGNGEELSSRIDALRALGDFHLLLVNYRGYGSSEGRPAEAALKADAAFILRSMQRNDQLALQRTIIVGRSLGSGIATYIADEFDVSALVLVSPYDSIADIAAGIYPWLPVKWLLRHPFNSVAHAGNILEPTLVIKAQFDSIVPHHHTDRLTNAFQRKIEIVEIPDTTHNRIFTAAFYQAVIPFLSRKAF